MGYCEIRDIPVRKEGLPFKQAISRWSIPTRQTHTSLWSMQMREFEFGVEYITGEGKYGAFLFSVATKRAKKNNNRRVRKTVSEPRWCVILVALSDSEID